MVNLDLWYHLMSGEIAVSTRVRENAMMENQRIRLQT